MTRYQALRKMEVDWFTSGFIAFANWLRDYPPHEIRFMSVVIEFDPTEPHMTTDKTPTDAEIAALYATRKQGENHDR